MAGDTFGYEYSGGKPRILYKGQDITEHLKNPDIDHWSSIISSQPLVREAVFDRQVRIGNVYDVVTEGRDTGSIVFPHADYKFFLTASPQVRAQRWQADQQRRGFEYSLEESLQKVLERDTRDRERTLSPLVEPEGATIIDNGDLDIEQTVDVLEKIVKG
jgi:cytidylate kinase